MMACLCYEVKKGFAFCSEKRYVDLLPPFQIGYYKLSCVMLYILSDSAMLLLKIYALSYNSLH